MIKYFIIAISFLSIASCRSIALLKPNSLNSNKNIALDIFLGYTNTKIIIQKNRYLHKPLSFLLNNLPIEATSYTYGVGVDTKFSSDIYLFFNDGTTNCERDEVNELTSIWVKWKTPLPLDSVINLISKTRGGWIEADKEFFQKQIIKDIAFIGF